MNNLLISTSEACTILGVSRRELQTIFPHLPHLRLKNGTKFFLDEYIRSYTQYLLLTHDKTSQRSARNFANEESTRELINKLKAGIDKALRAKIVLDTTQVAELLRVDRSVVTEWAQAGILEAERVEITPKRDRGKPRQVRLLIRTKHLRQALTWHIP